MPPGAAPEVPLEFTESQDRVVLDLARYIQYAALASLTLGGLLIVSGLAIWFILGGSFLSIASGFFSIVIGFGVSFLGLVLLSTSSDMRYIAETKGHDKIHLLNGLTSLNVYLMTLIGLASVICVLLLFRLFA
jgi:hypothetical protein